ncbi:hypothetical protein BD310DRAFT_925183 [Dichomitus squalens]|uniref:DUF7918 domain-containing protein n=1 Tax=Dichomitus squalens TaxID=114155 RepID=A0A4Q9PY49_9APHY|nr:hypothetical protein BD310DRAFT_925183 [Dichomitus squalens]
MRVEEVEVWITCDGHQLAEFGAEPSRSSPRTLACYIPSEAGKTFAFNWKSTMTLPSGVYLRYDFTIDGSSAGAQWSYQWEKPGSRWGVRTCLTLRRPFTFAPLTTTDDDAVCNDTEAMDLGTIQVRVWRGRSKPIADPTGSAEYIAFTPTSIVHERSKKAGVHCVTCARYA